MNYDLFLIRILLILGNMDVAANYMMSPELMANIQQNTAAGDFNIPMNPGAGGGAMPAGGMPGLDGLNEEQLISLMQQQPEMFAPLIEEIARHLNIFDGSNHG